MATFDEVWSRIRQHEGDVFRQIRGKEFRYAVVGSSVVPDCTNRLLPRSDFEKAFKLVPLSDTVPLQRLQGPSYIFAILMDPRVRAADW